MTTSIKIYPVGTGLLSPSELKQIADWQDREFAGLEVSQTYEWAVGGHFNLVLYLDEQFIGFVGVMKREVLFGDEKVLIGGIRGLVVETAFRSRGFGRLLMTEAQKVIFRTLKADFGCLLCLDSMKTFFAALGWKSFTCPVFVENRGQLQRWSEIAMVLDPEGKTAFSRIGKIDLRGKAF